jgi:hypothetical protein
MSTQGHVPAWLRDMFCAALAYGASEGAWWEWFDTLDADQFLWRERRGGEWEHRNARARAVWVLDQLATSTAVVPASILALHHLEAGLTYADVARRLRPSVAADACERQPEGAASMVPFRTCLPRGLLDALTRASAQTGMPREEIIRRALVAWLGPASDRVHGDN